MHRTQVFSPRFVIALLRNELHWCVDDFEFSTSNVGGRNLSLDDLQGFDGLSVLELSSSSSIVGSSRFKHRCWDLDGATTYSAVLPLGSGLGSVVA